MIHIYNDIVGFCETNTYFIYDDETMEGIIVDPGGEEEKLISTVQKLNFTPQAILITHGHFDHILAVPALKDKYGVKVYAGRTESEVMSDPSANLTASFMSNPITVVPDVLLDDDEEFTLMGRTFKALLTPGHTKGGMCFYIEQEKILLSGDTLFRESVGRSDFPGGSAALLVRKIAEKLLVLPGDTVVYPGHGESTDIAFEKTNNFYLAGL